MNVARVHFESRWWPFCVERFFVYNRLCCAGFLIDMDPEQFRLFMEQQSNMITQLITTVTQQRPQQLPQVQQTQPPISSVPVPQPSSFSVEGDMAENFDFLSEVGRTMKVLVEWTSGQWTIMKEK